MDDDVGMLLEYATGDEMVERKSFLAEESSSLLRGNYRGTTADGQQTHTQTHIGNYA